MSRPTAAQKRFWGRVVELGCLACLQEGKHTKPEIHHVKDFGKNNHSFVYGLCPIHHRPTAGVTGIPNRHGNPKEFAEIYGTDSELYIKCMSRLAGFTNEM